MYSDLLMQALGTHEDGPGPDDLLLAEVVDSRARLHETGAAAPLRACGSAPPSSQTDQNPFIPI